MVIAANCCSRKLDSPTKAATAVRRRLKLRLSFRGFPVRPHATIGETMLLKDIDPGSFRAKVWLLVLDKMVITAIVLGALAIYQHLETKESRDYAEDREEIQLAFRRAENLKELLPVVLDEQRENQLRNHMLVALIDTQSLSSSSAVDLASQILYSDGGEQLAAENSFLANTMVQVMPKGLGTAIDKYRDADAESNNFRDKHRRIALFWRHVILEALRRAQVLGSEELNSPDFLVRNFRSLLKFYPTVKANEAYEWSHGEVKGLRLLGAFNILDRAIRDKYSDREQRGDTETRMPAHSKRYLASSSSDINEPVLATLIVEKLHKDFVALPEVSNRILEVIQQSQVREAVRRHSGLAGFDERVHETANWCYRALNYLAWSAKHPDLSGQIEERVLPLVERFYDDVKSGHPDALDQGANLIDRWFVQVLMNTTRSRSSSHVPDEGTLSALKELFSLGNSVLEQAGIKNLANDWSKRGWDIVIDEQGRWRDRQEYEDSRYE